VRKTSQILLVLLVAAGAANRPRAETVDLRAFAGLGAGLGADTWIPGARVRIDADVATYWAEGFDWGGVGVIAPVAGTSRKFFGARAGYQLEHLGMDGADWRGSRYAHAPDVGLVGHLESAGGSAFEAQAGVEAVFREEATYCCDHAGLQTLSAGLRLLLRGDLALSPAWALFAEVGLRTGDHVLEIKFLPTAWAGVRVRL
jgi:hypothetical protein